MEINDILRDAEEPQIRETLGYLKCIDKMDFFNAPDEIPQ